VQVVEDEADFEAVAAAEVEAGLGQVNSYTNVGAGPVRRAWATAKRGSRK